MNLGTTPSDRFRQWLGRDDMANQAGHLFDQVKPAVEAIRKGAQVPVGVLSEVEVLVGAIDLGLQVSQNGVDPGELRQLPRLALANHDIAVRAARIEDTGKAGQPVTANVAAWHPSGLWPSW
jgi:hypothetical protein